MKQRKREDRVRKSCPKTYLRVRVLSHSLTHSGHKEATSDKGIRKSKFQKSFMTQRVTADACVNMHLVSREHIPPSPSPSLWSPNIPGGRLNFTMLLSQ